jgi:hypothetical protein
VREEQRGAAAGALGRRCHDEDTGGRLTHNGLDRSCAATIYPVLDKPRNSEALGPRGPY